MTAIRGTRARGVRVASALVLTAALMPGLTACSALTSTEGEQPLSGLALCALGHTWTTDLTDAATQVKASLTGDQVPVTNVTSTGTQTLEWSIEGHVVLTPDYTLTITTAPAEGEVVTVKQTHSGKATGAVYINGEVAIPRKWDGTGVNVDVVADNNGTVLENPPFDIPDTSFDDSVGLELTCNGDTLTIHPRGSDVTQTWKRSN